MSTGSASYARQFKQTSVSGKKLRIAKALQARWAPNIVRKSSRHELTIANHCKTIKSLQAKINKLYKQNGKLQKKLNEFKSKSSLNIVYDEIVKRVQHIQNNVAPGQLHRYHIFEDTQT